MQFGKVFLERWTVREEPSGFSWKQTSYVSPSPAVFSFRNVQCFSTCGAIIVDGWVIADTLVHANPEEHDFQDHGTWISINAGRRLVLNGSHLSALCGSADNYFHAAIDGIGRLAPMPAELVSSATSVLNSEMPPAAAQMLDVYCKNNDLTQTQVERSDLITIEELTISFNVAGQCNYHRSIETLFDTIGQNFNEISKPKSNKPIYLDRRRTFARRLRNEDRLVEALLAEGVFPVCLEQMDLSVRSERA